MLYSSQPLLIEYLLCTGNYIKELLGKGTKEKN